MTSSESWVLSLSFSKKFLSFSCLFLSEYLPSTLQCDAIYISLSFPFIWGVIVLPDPIFLTPFSAAPVFSFLSLIEFACLFLLQPALSSLFFVLLFSRALFSSQLFSLSSPHPAHVFFYLLLSLKEKRNLCKIPFFLIFYFISFLVFPTHTPFFPFSYSLFLLLYSFPPSHTPFSPLLILPFPYSLFPCHTPFPLVILPFPLVILPFSLLIIVSSFSFS
ncbi:unnamed protein product [Acanthosepion pharaonis]|uniref:Uncharacterized protein n=1 Tax=Acanthosepion pharaonis TaxID=158019 RepID=A0A812BGT0_ACAPH|nr:unnamed protein product [Sepia pharaonis]